MTRPKIHITDNAVLRHLELVDGIDVDAIRALIRRKVAVAMDHDGPCGVIVDGFTYKLVGKTVATVVPAHMPSKRTHRGRTR